MPVSDCGSGDGGRDSGMPKQDICSGDRGRDSGMPKLDIWSGDRGRDSGMPKLDICLGDWGRESGMPKLDICSGDWGRDSGMPKLHFSSKDGRMTIAWGNRFEALGKYSPGLFSGSKECSACILKSLCPDSGEGGAGIPKVPFLPAGSGEPMCEPEPSTGGSIVPIAGC